MLGLGQAFGFDKSKHFSAPLLFNTGTTFPALSLWHDNGLNCWEYPKHIFVLETTMFGPTVYGYTP